ncbi:MAG: nitrilase-related carbon-nitrogen hydrolase [Candidatus Thorarchaeota archaeon]
MTEDVISQTGTQKSVLSVLRIGIGQTEPVIGQPEANLRALRNLVVEADANDVDVLVLPELSNSGYAFESREEAAALSEVIPDGAYCRELARASTGRVVVAGVCEQTPKGLFNSAPVFVNGEHLLTYRKAHLFNREKDVFLPGDSEPPVFRFKEYRLGLMVCWDWVFPEMARILALKGAQVILHPANLVLPYCHRAMVTRSIENRVFTVTANRVGEERGLSFYGESQVVAPNGEVLLTMGGSDTGLAWVDIDPARADDKMMTERNHLLNDRRPELYRRLVED